MAVGEYPDLERILENFYALLNITITVWRQVNQNQDPTIFLRYLTMLNWAFEEGYAATCRLYTPFGIWP